MNQCFTAPKQHNLLIQPHENAAQSAVCERFKAKTNNAVAANVNHSISNQTVRKAKEGAHSSVMKSRPSCRCMNGWINFIVCFWIGRHLIFLQRCFNWGEQLWASVWSKSCSLACLIVWSPFPRVGQPKGLKWFQSASELKPVRY